MVKIQTSHEVIRKKHILRSPHCIQ